MGAGREGLGFGVGVWVEVDWVRQESRDEISGAGGMGVGTRAKFQDLGVSSTLTELVG